MEFPQDAGWGGRHKPSIYLSKRDAAARGAVGACGVFPPALAPTAHYRAEDREGEQP